MGVSSCLLGLATRYDGDHKHHPVVVDLLGSQVEWVTVCPEVELGLPVPRDPMHLAGDPAAPRLVVSRSGEDLTRPMLSWCRRRVLELERHRLQGFVFKSRSPSCGVERVKVLDGQDRVQLVGAGLFARSLTEHLPRLPVVQEDQLDDPAVRQDFLQRVRSY